MKKFVAALAASCILSVGMVAPAQAHTVTRKCTHSNYWQTVGPLTQWWVQLVHQYRNPKTGNHIHRSLHTKYVYVPAVGWFPYSSHQVQKVCAKH